MSNQKIIGENSESKVVKRQKMLELRKQYAEEKLEYQFAVAADEGNENFEGTAELWADFKRLTMSRYIALWINGRAS